MKDKHKILLLWTLIFLSIFSIYFLKPKIAGDSLLYTSSIDVLKTGIQPEGFVPMMIASTQLGLRLIMFFDIFFKNISISWLFLDIVLYILIGLSFYSLLERLIKNREVAFLGTIFLVTNYAAVTFGLGYLMDAGGWAAYLMALYFAHKYLWGDDNESADKFMYTSALIIGIGGLYKEYSFVAYVVLLGTIVYKNWGNWVSILKKSFLTGLLVLVPFIIMNIHTYINFDGYTYLDWFLYNQHAYDYQNRPIEFIKSFGSIYNFGWFLFLPGLFIFIKNVKSNIKDKNNFFILMMLLSCFSVLLWPVVTRVLFITMPTAVVITSLFLNKINKKLYLILPILILYILTGYFMDSFVLDFVNLPI